MKEENMEWYEIIHIRLFSGKYKEEAMSVFSQLKLPKLAKGIKTIELLQDILMNNDFRILIRWENDRNGNMKSTFGRHLAATLERFGRVHHTVNVGLYSGEGSSA